MERTRIFLQTCCIDDINEIIGFCDQRIKSHIQNMSWERDEYNDYLITCGQEPNESDDESIAEYIITKKVKK